MSHLSTSSINITSSNSTDTIYIDTTDVTSSYYTMSPNYYNSLTSTTIGINSDLIINRGTFEDRLKAIEDALGIPERDVKLEKKHPKLKELYDEYMQALKKYRMWEDLNP